MKYKVFVLLSLVLLFSAFVYAQTTPMYSTATWVCYDGLKNTQTSSCKSSSEWSSMAKSFCLNRCGSAGKCGVNSFGVSNECGITTPSVSACTDSDGGVNPYVKGSCSDSRGVKIDDGCLSSSGAGPTSSGAYVDEAFCLTPAMKEYCKRYNDATYCDNLPNDCYMIPLIPTENMEWSYFARDTRLFCPYGCSNGVCLNLSITVASPNGGDIWYEGNDYRITWRPSNTENPSLPKIDEYILDANGNNAITPSLNRDNTGWDTWTPRGVSGQFKIKICQSGTSNCDMSDNYFTITQPTPCTDSDGGKNYNQYGETTGYTSGVNQVYTSKDMCLQTGLNKGDLQESWCNGNSVSTEIYNCPYGCSNGACLNQNTTSTVCTADYRPVCGMPPTPTCAQGVLCKIAAPVPTTYSNRCMMDNARAAYLYDGECKTCKDSDGGMSFYTAGFVSMNDPSYGTNGRKLDVCTGNALTEYYC
jgi:hypothetical protein